MTDYTSKPAQFRLPHWANEFLAEESRTRHMSKTQVVLEGLERLRQSHHDELMKEGYIELAEVHLEEVREWDSTLKDGLEDEEW